MRSGKSKCLLANAKQVHLNVALLILKLMVPSSNTYYEVSGTCQIKTIATTTAGAASFFYSFLILINFSELEEDKTGYIQSCNETTLNMG